MKTIDDTKKSRKINHLGIVFFVFFFKLFISYQKTIANNLDSRPDL
jgi:hypothetical protein